MLYFGIVPDLARKTAINTTHPWPNNKNNNNSRDEMWIKKNMLLEGGKVTMHTVPRPIGFLVNYDVI